MTRKYLSPTASAFARAGLLLIECLIGLYNLITFPIRKIGLKSYLITTCIGCAIYAGCFYADLQKYLALFILSWIGFTAIIIVSKLLHKALNKKVLPKVAYLINSPLGIPLNKFYRVEV